MNVGVSRLPFIGPVWFTVKRIIARFLSSGTGVPIQLGDQKVHIHPFSIAYGIQTWEPYTTRLFQSALKSGSTVLDIGAHHGYFSILAANCVGPEGIVYAFEPSPENFTILKRNIELNRLENVIPVNMAVTDRSATLPFFFLQQTGVTGSLFSAHKPGEMTVPVECVSIDEYLKGTVVDVVKMDIEGGEPSALDGMRDILSHSADAVLFVEINQDCLIQAGSSPKKLITKLNDAGFRCQDIDETNKTLGPVNLRVAFSNIYCSRSPNTRALTTTC